MSGKRELIGAAVAVLLSLPAYAQTGASGSTSDRLTTTGTGTSKVETGADTGANFKPTGAMVLAFIHRTNQNEIEMANLAKEKSSNNAVKSFAEQLIKDHKDADDQVQSFAKAHNIDLKATEEQLEAAVKERKSETMDDMVRSREVQSPTGEYARPFSRESLAPSAMHKKDVDDLRKLKGQDFDRQFVRDMTKNHQRAIQHLTSARSRIDDTDVQQLIDKLLPTLQKHESMARQLEGAVSVR